MPVGKSLVVPSSLPEVIGVADRAAEVLWQWIQGLEDDDLKATLLHEFENFVMDPPVLTTAFVGIGTVESVLVQQHCRSKQVWARAANSPEPHGSILVWASTERRPAAKRCIHLHNAQ